MSRTQRLFVAYMMMPLLWGSGFLPAARAIPPAAGNSFMPEESKIADIDGVVQDFIGKPVAGAKVIWCMDSNDAGAPLTTSTDAKGRFHFDKTAWLKNGAYGAVLVEADGCALAIRSALGMKNQPVLPPLVFTLEPVTEARFKLLTPEGKPAEGVRVGLSGLLGNTIFSGVVDGRLSAVSGPDGIAVLPGLPQGDTAVFKTSDTRYAQLKWEDSVLHLSRTALSELRTIKLARASTVEGVITYPDGKPVAGATIDAQVINRHEPVAGGDSCADGRFALHQMAAGDYYLTATLPKALAETWTTHTILFSLSEGKSKGDLKILLVKPATISGRVLYRGSGKPAQDADYVTAGVPDNLPGGDTAVPGPDGSYSFRLAGGSYNFKVQTKYDILDVQNLTVQDGEVKTVDLYIGPSAPSLVVDGIVTDQNGKPIAGAQVESSLIRGGEASNVSSGADGKFKLTVVETPMAWLRARKDDDATVKDMLVFNGDHAELKLADHAVTKITGKVLDTNGKPLARVQVNALLPAFWSEISGNGVLTDESGNYTIDNMYPGHEYTVEASMTGYGNVYLDRSIESRPGIPLNIDDITLKPANSYVAGRVIDSQGAPLANAYVELGDGDYKTKLTDQQGRFRINGSPHAEVPVSVSSGSEWTDLLVKAGKDGTVIQTHSLLGTRPHDDPAHPAGIIGKPAPELAASDWVNTRGISLSALKGKIVILNIWDALDIGEYRVNNMLDMNAIAQQFADRGVVCIGLRGDGGTRSEIQERAAKDRLTIPMGLDRHGETEKALGLSGTDAFAVIDRTGKIAYAGYEIDKVIETLANLLKK